MCELSCEFGLDTTQLKRGKVVGGITRAGSLLRAAMMTVPNKIDSHALIRGRYYCPVLVQSKFRD